jgi:hypothetical protein
MSNKIMNAWNVMLCSLVSEKNLLLPSGGRRSVGSYLLN